MRWLVPVLALTGLVPVSCGGSGAPPEEVAHSVESSGTTAATLQPDDRVNLTLYFRAGEGPHGYLAPAVREVPVDQDLARHSLELLLAGPTEGEDGLDAAVPSTTRIEEFEIRKGVARVVLSPEIVRDAGMVGDSPANEALALAAIVNTLTELPSVEHVRLEVRGQGIDPEGFWGGWGLPRVLVRDETLVGAPVEGSGVPELGRFTTRPQSIGSEEARGAQLAGVRVQDRLTHVRLVLKLADPADPAADPAVPQVRARGFSEAVVLELSGVEPGGELPVEAALELSDRAFHRYVIDNRGHRTAVRLEVDGARERRFWLHSLTGPTRVVLDVKK